MERERSGVTVKVNLNMHELSFLDNVAIGIWQHLTNYFSEIMPHYSCPTKPSITS